jgi:hypothetical protein
MRIAAPSPSEMTLHSASYAHGQEQAHWLRAQRPTLEIPLGYMCSRKS